MRAKQRPEGRSRPPCHQCCFPGPHVTCHVCPQSQQRPGPQAHTQPPAARDETQSPAPAAGWRDNRRTPLCVRLCPGETESLGGAQGAVQADDSNPTVQPPLLRAAGTGLSPLSAGRPARPLPVLSPATPVLRALRSRLSPVCTCHSSRPRTPSRESCLFGPAPILLREMRPAVGTWGECGRARSARVSLPSAFRPGGR